MLDGHFVRLYSSPLPLLYNGRSDSKRIMQQMFLLCKLVKFHNKPFTVTLVLIFVNLKWFPRNNCETSLKKITRLIFATTSLSPYMLLELLSSFSLFFVPDSSICSCLCLLLVIVTLLSAETLAECKLPITFFSVKSISD